MRAEMGRHPSRVPPSQLNLPPGFRFCPTDEELVVHYLSRKAACEPFAVPIIAEVELYKFDPWDLPAKALFGEKEWYFFSCRDRKYPNGSRPNRAAGTGYWKATGTDKPISAARGGKVGVKKALVFYEGKPPKGVKTNWIMHEYRLADCGAPRLSAKRKSSLRLDDWVLCRIYKKSSSAATTQMKVGSSNLDGKGEQSESSSLDDVATTLSERDDPTDELPAEADQEAHTGLQVDGMELVASTASGLDDVYQQQQQAASSQSLNADMSNSQGLSADLRAYMRELEAAAATATSQGTTAGDEGNGAVFGYTDRMWQQVGTPESNESSRQSALESTYSTGGGGFKQEEDLSGESRFDELAGLPLPQLLSSSMNTQNLGFPITPLFGLDLGLPSPCTMLAQGRCFGGSIIDPDNYLFQPSHLGWDPTRITFSG